MGGWGGGGSHFSTLFPPRSLHTAFLVIFFICIAPEPNFCIYPEHKATMTTDVLNIWLAHVKFKRGMCNIVAFSRSDLYSP